MRDSVSHDLARSFAAMRQHPLYTVGLGVALLVSQAAVCCGIGAFTAPWLLCELLGFQLGVIAGSKLVRTWAWLSAGVLAFGAVMIVTAGAALAALGASPSPEVVLDTEAAASVLEVSAVSAVALGAVVATVALVVPMLFAPIILIDRGGSLLNAILESARLVRNGGVLRHARLSLASHVVQVAPLALALLVTALALQVSTVPFALLASTPLVAASLPLGQGMIVSRYATHRAGVLDAARLRAPSGLPRGLVGAWAVAFLAPLVAVGLLGAVLVIPSRIRPLATLPDRAPVVTARISDGARAITLPTTSVTVRASAERVRIVAEDGGGAGRLDFDARPVEEVRAWRIRDDHVVGIRAGGRWFGVRIDDAGVRRDDDFVMRLGDRVPRWVLWLFFTSLLATSAVAWRALGALGALRAGDLSPRCSREGAVGYALVPLHVASFGAAAWTALETFR